MPNGKFLASFNLQIPFNMTGMSVLLNTNAGLVLSSALALNTANQSLNSWQSRRLFLKS